MIEFAIVTKLAMVIFENQLAFDIFTLKKLTN